MLGEYKEAYFIFLFYFYDLYFLCLFYFFLKHMSFCFCHFIWIFSSFPLILTHSAWSSLNIHLNSFHTYHHFSSFAFSIYFCLPFFIVFFIIFFLAAFFFFALFFSNFMLFLNLSILIASQLYKMINVILHICTTMSLSSHQIILIFLIILNTLAF